MSMLKAWTSARGRINLPGGYNIIWSGQYEYMQRAAQRLMIVVPLTLLIIIFIIYLNTRSVIKTAIVMLAVPFSLVGAIGILALLHYNLSVAVWVGIIALAGLDAETGVVMLLYLDLAYEDWKKRGLLTHVTGLRDAIYHGAVKRVRPKAMTACVIIGGLAPILWSHGAGADVMKRIATPMIGGVVTSTISRDILRLARASERGAALKGNSRPGDIFSHGQHLSMCLCMMKTKKAFKNDKSAVWQTVALSAFLPSFSTE